jgi:uncharacterized membrane protein YGL010W
MQNITSLLSEYGESHQNPWNKLIHWICVPVIVWTVVALLWSIPFPATLQSDVFPVNWATVVLVLAQIYYFRLSIKLWPLWKLALTVFVIAWIGQFIGHMIEGKRPSFFKDVQFLLIGPAWLMAFVYRALGVSYQDSERSKNSQTT